MKNLIIALFIGLSALGLSALVAPAPAQADPASYIYELENSDTANFKGNRQWYIDLGYAVCSDLQNGTLISTEINVIMNASRGNFDYVATRELIHTAIAELC